MSKMSKTSVSFDAVAHLRREVGDAEWAALTDPGNLKMIKRFALWLVKRVGAFLLPVPLSDEEACVRFPQIAAKIASWRVYATAVGYKGPVVWLPRAGFTLKAHAPKAGPCYDNLGYLQSWQIRNDESISDSIVFWVPRLAEGSTVKTPAEMEALRMELRSRYELPVEHCDRFGSIALLFALILAHFKRTGKRVPLQFLYAASDTFREDGVRLIAGYFLEHGLYCLHWDGHAYDYVGFFLLGVEELGTS